MPLAPQRGQELIAVRRLAIGLRRMHRAFANQRGQRVGERDHPAGGRSRAPPAAGRSCLRGSASTTAGVLSSTSRAATRPPRSLRSSTCETTPRSGAGQRRLHLLAALRPGTPRSAVRAPTASKDPGPRRRPDGPTRRRRAPAPTSSCGCRSSTISTSGSSRRRLHRRDHRVLAADLALADERALALVNEIDLRLDRDDVIAAGAIDQIDERGQRAWTFRCRGTGHEDQAVRLAAERLHFRGTARAGPPRSPAPEPSGRARPARDDHGTSRSGPGRSPGRRSAIRPTARVAARSAQPRTRSDRRTRRSAPARLERAELAVDAHQRRDCGDDVDVPAPRAAAAAAALQRRGHRDAASPPPSAFGCRVSGSTTAAGREGGTSSSLLTIKRHRSTCLRSFFFLVF